MALTNQERKFYQGYVDAPGSTKASEALEKVEDTNASAAELNQVADVSAQPVHRTIVIDVTAPGDGNETDTGVTLPTGCLVTDVTLNVTTAESTGGTTTLDIGVDGSNQDSATGLASGLECGSATIVKPTLASGGQTVGALMSANEDGAGVLVPEPLLVTDSDANVTITAGSADWAEFVGQIYVHIIDMSGEPY